MKKIFISILFYLFLLNRLTSAFVKYLTSDFYLDCQNGQNYNASDLFGDLSFNRRLAIWFDGNSINGTLSDDVHECRLNVDGKLDLMMTIEYLAFDNDDNNNNNNNNCWAQNERITLNLTNPVCYSGNIL